MTTSAKSFWESYINIWWYWKGHWASSLEAQQQLTRINKWKGGQTCGFQQRSAQYHWSSLPRFGRVVPQLQVWTCAPLDDGVVLCPRSWTCHLLQCYAHHSWQEVPKRWVMYGYARRAVSIPFYANAKRWRCRGLDLDLLRKHYGSRVEGMAILPAQVIKMSTLSNIFTVILRCKATCTDAMQSLLSFARALEED